MDVNNTRLQSYIAYWRSVQTNTFVELGITKVGTPEFGAKGAYVNLDDADAFFGRIASQKTGWEVMCKITLQEISYAELYSRILQGQTGLVIDGVKKAYDGDTSPVNMTRDISGELRLIPLAAPAGDLSECITMWKAAPQVDLKLAGDRTKYQTVDVEFMAYPDSTRKRAGFPFSAAYFRLGDPTAIASDPDYIGFTFGDQPVAPYKHTPAFSIDAGDKKKTFAYGAFTANKVAGNTVALNGAIATVTQTSVVYQTKTIAGESLTGQYVIVDSEILYVTLDTQSTTTTGTLTVVRAALFSTAATHLTATVCTQQDPLSLAVIPVTDRATFASGTPATATVGDSSSTGSLVFGDKGLVTHVAAGTTNVTATIGLTVSKNLVVTAT